MKLFIALTILLSANTFSYDLQEHEIVDCLYVQKGLVDGKLAEKSVYTYEEVLTFFNSEEETKTKHKEKKVQLYLYIDEKPLPLSESKVLESIITESIDETTFYETSNIKKVVSKINYNTKRIEKTFSEQETKVLFKKDGDTLRSIYVQIDGEYQDYVIEKNEVDLGNNMKQVNTTL